ncbi:shikimate kinase [Streptococcus ictaluri]|uniref:Shikimate kinase n=1 Tax=Streptococcus ictaluri 707-05 TaxID=764299 RepID=G5K142_9STRE|nr:hypothetical protein [Streptococcus ictaluri]EHI70428.1 hypothetical protein STRIC_0318 [Streptococcus ictaluri 707-05]
MHLVMIGAQASGKMTIGQEIAKRTKMTLFHNHESIDFVLRFMPWSEETLELIHNIRFDFFEAFAKSRQKMIFTVVINFADSQDITFLEEIQNIFNRHGQEVCFVELETDLSERLRRNKTENRLSHKPLKQDVEWSERDILDTMEYAVYNPEVAPQKLKKYYKLNNTELTAEEAALKIITLMDEEG